MKVIPCTLLQRLSLGLAVFFAPVAASAAELFPGLQTVLTPAEYARAGLDKLTPDQIGVIDAALIRYCAKTVDAAAGVKAVAIAQRQTDVATKQGWLERFGLVSSGADWRTLPPLKARVVAWIGSNRFKLDNGQIWEGTEAIPFELVGHDIEIAARPHRAFVLSIDGRNAAMTVVRIR